jgi:hypothetical protein
MKDIALPFLIVTFDIGAFNDNLILQQLQQPFITLPNTEELFRS